MQPTLHILVYMPNHLKYLTLFVKHPAQEIKLTEMKNQDVMFKPSKYHYKLVGFGGRAGKLRRGALVTGTGELQHLCMFEHFHRNLDVYQKFPTRQA